MMQHAACYMLMSNGLILFVFRCPGTGCPSKSSVYVTHRMSVVNRGMTWHVTGSECAILVKVVKS